MSVPFDITVQAQLDGTWTDITDDTLYHHRVRIRRGASSESQTAPPVQCALALRDDAGNSQSVAGTYDPYNPNSPYFGSWGENTPLRVYLGTPHLGAGRGFVNDTSHVAPSITAAEAGLLCCMWVAQSTGNYTLPGGMTALTEQDDGSNTSRAAYESVSSGATGTRTATFSTSALGAGTSVVLHGSSLVVEDAQAGAASSGSVTLTIDATAGWWLVAMQWANTSHESVPFGDEGGWIPVAPDAAVVAWVKRVGRTGEQDVVFTTQNDGVNHATLIAVSGDVTDWDFRFTGEVSSVTHDWTVENDVRADVVASGLLRRLQQGSTPLLSALRRIIIRAPQPPVAYWHLEDESGSTTAASGLAGGSAMTASGSVAFGALTSVAGSAPLADMAVDTGTLSGLVAGSGTSWALSFVVLRDDTTSWTAVTIHLADGGTYTELRVTLSSTLDVIGVRSSDGGTETVMSATGVSDGEVHVVEIATSSILGYALSVDDVAVDSDNTVTNAQVRRVVIGAATNGTAGIGHVAVYSTAAINLYEAALGYPGETAGRRFLRLCREEGITAHIVGDPDETEAMGPQTVATLVSLLRSCEATDMGIMYEPREVLGLAYRTRRSLYNQPATLSADYGDLVAPLNPAADDRFVRNDVTVSRRNGSYARSVQETGPKNIQDPPNGVGRYDTTVTVDAQSDLRLPDLASWQRHLGTVDARRFPAISAKLQGLSTATARSFRGVDVGDRLEVATNLPARLQSTGVDQLALGYTETLTSHTWDWATNTAPVAPYRILEIGLDGHDILGSDSATIAEDLDATETEVDVNCGAGPDIIHEVDYDIVIGGEQMTITAVSAMSGTFPNRTCTLTVTRSVNGVVKSHSSGTAIQMAPRVFVG